MKTSNRVISRRIFLESGARSAGLLALGGSVIGNHGPAVGAEKPSNPFAYNVEHLAKTDPTLVKYEQVSHFAARNPEPRRLALGPQDRIYVAAKTGVSILDPQGVPIGDIPLSDPARAIAVAADGTLYVGMRDHIEVFDSKSALLAAWDSPGKKTWFSGLAVGQQDVFAADSGNRVVLHYDRAGKLKGRIGEKSKERNVPGLIVPSPYLDVALGRDGLLHVNNPGRHSVEAYTLNGDLELSWGKPSGSIEGFCGCCNPIALTMLPDGKHVTCEKGLPRVKVYAADGTFECVVAGPESFPENARTGSLYGLSCCSMGGLDAAVDSRGRIHVLDLVAGDVQVMQRKA